MNLAIHEVEDKLELFMIHTWRSREFGDFLIFERHFEQYYHLRVGVAFNYGHERIERNFPVTKIVNT
jgi:hypothetical protein